MTEAAATEVKKSRKRGEGDPAREIKPRPLYLVYTIDGDVVTTHLTSRKAEDVLADVAANPERKYLRIMVK